MTARSRGALGLAAALLGTLGMACSDTSGSSTTTAASPPPTTPAPTSTTLASQLPATGTIPLATLGDVVRGDDLVATGRRALQTWLDTPVECYPSKAEALAARDQFDRVATYLGRVRGAARDMRDANAFKETIVIESDYRGHAATRRFVACNSAGDETRSTTSTTVEGGTTQGLAAGGVVEVGLTITGDPKVDQEFTVGDAGAPCDGFGANTTFLVSSQDGAGRWVIIDVIVDKAGLTSASVIPTRAGAGAIEYLAYCGTLDKRHGVTTYMVRPTGDTTTTLSAPSTTSPNMPLVVVDLPTASRPVVIDPRASEVAVEPESVTEFLAANDSVGGVVIARLGLGDWIALRESEVTWVPVGPGDDGLEMRIVGARNAIELRADVVAPTTTTTQPATTSVANAPTAAPTTIVTVPSDDDDTTLWVIIALVTVAALTVLLSRLRLRR